MEREDKTEIEILQERVTELEKEIEQLRMQIKSSNLSNFKMLSMANMANMCQGSPGRHMPPTARAACEGADALLLEWKKRGIK